MVILLNGAGVGLYSRAFALILHRDVAMVRKLLPHSPHFVFFGMLIYLGAKLLKD